ncbi:uncharacterized protein LOC103753929 [Manacus vitellinus]|uniref:uncharacterized protein LOC103753929 n=1 Tax=Manacus vitellinus TaxID=328815 RepID=UPI00115E67D4|nr:uncharacterized protein LOC103753929 [Manacus vitellinus]
MAGLRVRSLLVTGANRGIGLGLVQHFLKMPNPPQWVFAGCRDPKGQRAKELQNLASKHPNLVIVPLEVASPASINTAATTVREHVGGSGLNLLINNAGIAKITLLENETPENMTETYTTNTVGPLLMGQVPLQPPLPSHHHPCPVSPQAALNMLSKCQSLAYKEHGIFCVALHPGWVQTDMGSSAGHTPPVTVDDSVKGMLKVLSSLSEKDTGTFLDWEGKVVPW